jgi:hypothetical protein
MNINKLPASALKEIDSIIDRKCAILTTDAKGVGREAQKYLLEKHYDNVIVYFSGGEIRNNAGNWKAKAISGDAAGIDKALAHDADYGLMIWNGLSIGTLNTIKAMKDSNKRFDVVLDGAIYDEENIDILINTHMNR